MKSIIYYILISTVILFAGCQKEDISTASQESEMVSCALSLSVEPMSYAVSETKSVSASSDETSTITSLWIAQFDESGKQLGNAQFFDDYSEITIDNILADILSEDKEIIELIGSSGNNHSVVFIANVLEDALTYLFGVGVDIDVIRAAGDAISSYDYSSGGQYMSYIYNGVITASSEFDVTLKRNIAKVAFTVSAGSELTISSVQLCNIPKEVSYLAAGNNNDYADAPFPLLSNRVDATAVTENLTSQQTYYIPANMQGVVEESTEEQYKPKYANSLATYVLVKATNGTNSYEYRFYLGENFTTDFNLKPNNIYKYTISLEDVGDPLYDARITDVTDSSIIDYTTNPSSNCYILNPTEQAQTIYIPYLERINDFWVNYAHDASMAIDKDSDLSTQLLWYDQSENPNIGFSVVDATYDEYTTKSGEKAIKITLPANCSVGNVSYAVKNSVGEILWSWHLWITDYNPDGDRTYVDEYCSTVKGGEVHRYSGSDWQTGGVYDDKVIMDRNLGALDATYDGHGLGTSTNAGALYYQFGRKDPLPYWATYSSSVYGSSNEPLKATVNTSGRYFYEAVKLPTTFFYMLSTTLAYGDWCIEAPVGTEYIWNDKNATTSNNRKSIFDPSPLGWKLISSANTYEDFNKEDSFLCFGSWLTGDSAETESGRVYNGFAYYYPAGLRYRTTGNAQNIGNDTYMWSGLNSSTADMGYSFSFGVDYITSKSGVRKSSAEPVRCVQE